VLLDGQSVVKSLRQKISADQSPRKKLRTSCPIEWGVLRKIVADKNISLKTRWIEGHAGITGTELADSAANATSSAL
jgi:ribonuclease HI